MDEYIKREDLISTICMGCNEEFSEEPCEPDCCAIRRAIKNIPTADVVPKSEVERLNAVMKEMDEQRAYTINMLGESLETAKRDVEVMGAELSRYTENLMQMREQDKRNIAREIFAEIEKHFVAGTTYYGHCIYTLGVGTFAELKKKYTEENNNENKD